VKERESGRSQLIPHAPVFLIAAVALLPHLSTRRSPFRLRTDKGHCRGQVQSHTSACRGMSGNNEAQSNEEAAMEAASERSAVPYLRDLLRREYDEGLKGRPRDFALEKWGAEIEAQVLRDLETGN